MNGKGSRPRKVDTRKWNERWERIFGAKRDQPSSRENAKALLPDPYKKFDGKLSISSNGKCVMPADQDTVTFPLSILPPELAQKMRDRLRNES